MSAPMAERACCCLAAKLRLYGGLKRIFASQCRYTSSSSTVNDSDRKETHFGYEYIPEDEKEGKVYEVFENVASKYDMMNDTMSAGVHRLWKDYFMERMGPTSGTKLIDVAGGTGDIALRFLRYTRSNKDSTVNQDFNIKIPGDIEGSEPLDNEAPVKGTYPAVTVCDINQAMLDEGKAKAERLGINTGVKWLQGNAEELPIEDNIFDVYTIAYGIRNCTHIDKVLKEAYRVLKPGGRFMCLEFSRVTNPLLRMAYDNYSFQVIPVMGQVIAGDWKSYQYLVESIRQFPAQEEFSALIRQAGFRMVTHENLTFGVSAIHSGFKIV